MSEDIVHCANRWREFYEEDGGLRDVLDTLRRAYFDRASELMPNDTAALFKLGMAAKIVEQVDMHIRHILTAGRMEQAAQDHADRIAKLPEARRRFL
jgi:hypothetical protein